MKQVSQILAVFLFFILVLSSVRFLESYSNQYRSCADEWMSKAKQIKSRPESAARFLERLDHGYLSIEGKDCPVMSPLHKRAIKAQSQA